MATKIISYNVNGLRSALSKDWLKWLKAANPDVICLQEIKCFPDEIKSKKGVRLKIGSTFIKTL